MRSVNIRDISGIRGVADVTPGLSTMRGIWDSVTLVYFLCPCLSTKGIMLNPEATGFTARYVNRLSFSAKQRRAKASKFQCDAEESGWICRPVPIWGSGDARILYSPSLAPPLPPPYEGLETIIQNYVPVVQNLTRFQRFYEDQPWLSSPLRVVRQAAEHEGSRLMSILPDNAPKALREDFVRRVFAGFALDGVLLREGVFGHDPMILGVESPGVAILQNVALPFAEQIPVIQLK